MREILFKGKRDDNGEWIFGYYVHLPIGRCGEEEHLIQALEADGRMGILHRVIPETVGQYTGLKDKNGKRIFEGDICQNIKTGEIVSVKWHGTMAGFVWVVHQGKGHNFDFGELFRAYDKYKIIGNIHDNPELLEVEHAR